MLLNSKIASILLCCMLAICLTACGRVSQGNQSSGNQDMQEHIADDNITHSTTNGISIGENDDHGDANDEQAVPKSDQNIEVLSNMYNQARFIDGLLHHYDGKTLFEFWGYDVEGEELEEHGTYLSYDYGQTMTKVFDETGVFTYRDRVYLMKADGMYVSDFEGNSIEKISDITPQMVLDSIYSGENYEAIVLQVIGDRVIFADYYDNFINLYSLNLDGANLQKISSYLNNSRYVDEQIYYRDQEKGIFCMGLDGKNSTLILEEAKISDYVVYNNLIYYNHGGSGNKIYAYNMDTQKTELIFDGKARVTNIIPDGLVLRMYEPEGVGVYSFSKGEISMLTDTWYMDVFVAGSKVFGFNSEEKKYVVLN